jgi:hypothetical protein
MSEDPLFKLYSQVTPKKLEFNRNTESNLKVFQPYEPEKDDTIKKKSNPILKTSHKTPSTNVTHHPFPQTVHTPTTNETNDDLQGNFDLTKDYSKSQKNNEPSEDNELLDEKPLLEG